MAGLQPDLLSSSSCKPDRRKWAIHRRGYAVLKEEGFPGVVRRFTSYGKEFYRRIVPPDPTEIYDANFYQMSRTSNSYCSALADWLINVFESDCVLDVGCGDCSLLLALSRRGVNTYGLDGSAAAVQTAPAEVLVFLTQLNRPFLLNKVFPLVCCLEVAEHLPGRAGKVLIAALVRHARKTILFSAAHPGQGGVGHVNEQPREYWLSLFGNHGWIERASETQELRQVLKSSGAPEYLLQNIIVLQRSGSGVDVIRSCQ